MSVQHEGIKYGILLVGLKFDIFNLLYGNPIEEKELIHFLGFDFDYVKKWLTAAEGYQILRKEDGIYSLTIFGEKFSEKHPNNEIANLIQGVFSVLIAHEIIPDLKCGRRAGYEIVEKFPNIKPWYSFVHRNKNLHFIDEIFSSDRILDFLNDLKGNIVDYSCGNGWFLKEIEKVVDDCILYGVDDQKETLEGIVKIGKKEFSNYKAKFDLVILNKVLHHIWREEDKITSIINKLSKNGKIMIWEFNGDFMNQDLFEFRELSFLNFVEHIQSGEFVSRKAVKNYFESRNFNCTTVDIDSCRQIIYLISKD